MPRPRLSQLAIVVAVVAALAVGYDGLDPSPAKARKGYGGYNPCKRGCQVQKCRKTCGRARRTCIYCVKQDLRPLRAACRGQGGSAGRTCKAEAKAQIRQAMQQCRGATGSCNGCCRERADYAGGCTASFSETSGFGSYFRTVPNYGKVKRYKPECDGSTGGASGNAAACARRCERARAVALRACGVRAKVGCDPAAIETEYQQCRARCE